MKINIALADDQQLFLRSLSSLVNTFTNFTIVADALNGEELINKLLHIKELPQIVIIDVQMPIMDGAMTVEYLANKYPQIKSVALSMKDDDTTIIKMLKAGCSAYLLKDIHPTELERALEEIHEKGYYNADAANINYRRLITINDNLGKPAFSNQELGFLKLACSDLTYKQVAAQMHLAERTIDGYRESLFRKLKVQSRVGMALEAIRLNLVEL